MKPEVLIKLLKDPNDRSGNDVDMEAVMETIIQALEKQVAIKPRYYIDNWDHNRPGCPGCPRNEILYAGQKYCSVCGTKIDWGKDHE